MRPTGIFVLTALLAAFAVPRRLHAGDATGALAPYEDVLEVIADLTWHLKDDVYRFPPPRDPTGHDLYRLSLLRLESWERRFPSRLHDVTSFGRAEALERLGEFARATDAYEDVAHGPSPLAPRARDGAERARAFAEAAAMPETGPDLDAVFAALRAKLDAWSKLVTRNQQSPHEAIALVEEERLEAETAALGVAHRHDLEHGDETAERSLRFLVEKHADSKALPEHILRLADLYADFTRDWLDAHARPLAFDEGEFTKRADRALDMYRKVATWDGTAEKPEAQARFAALDAWKASTLARYR
jgi:hypothetical protein